MLKAAQRVFGEFGFSGANLDAIARAAGVSKMTIYSYFPSKKSLCEAVAASAGEALALRLDYLDPSRPREALTRIGTAFLALNRSAGVVGGHRLAYSASTHCPAAARAFYEQGPLQTLEIVAEYLRAADQVGRLRVNDAEIAADQFLALFLGLGHISSLLGLGVPTASEDRALVRANVGLFMSRYGA